MLAVMPTAQLVWWGGIEQRDGIDDLDGGWLEKTNERGSNRLRSGSKPNPIGAEHDKRDLTPHDALARLAMILSQYSRTDTSFSFSRLLPALP